MARLSAADRYAARQTRKIADHLRRAQESERLRAWDERMRQFEPHYFDAWTAIVERYNRAGVV